MVKYALNAGRVIRDREYLWGIRRSRVMLHGTRFCGQEQYVDVAREQRKCTLTFFLRRMQYG